MPQEKPSPEIIDRWIAGTLPGDAAAEVERFFEENPEALPGGEPTVRFLREAASVEESGDDLSSLMNSLKGRVEVSLEDLTQDSWRELLEPTEEEGVLGKLEQYEVLELVANTGMATVLKARDSELDRIVAIKMLSPALATNSTARERFLREARAMATLENDYILPIYDVFHGGSPWFVMRFIEGGTLQDALDAGDERLQEPKFVEQLAYKMATALSVAHRAGIIHRDLKPANILSDEEADAIWLTDFGIARAIEDPGLTYGATVAGTPRYMSPEQAMGESLDSRSDLFSLGSVLYHVATGKPPFDGDTTTALLYQVTRAEATPVGKVNPNLPPWLASLIDGLLSKDPDDRPENAAAVLAIISSQKVIRKPRKWMYPAALLGAGLVAVFVFTIRNDFSPDGDGEESQMPTVVTAGPQEIISEKTGYSYGSLQSALNSIKETDTLFLRGDFVIEEPLKTHSGSSVRIHGAKGATATIRFRHQGKYGILFQGNGSARRVNFVSEERADGFIALQTQNAQYLDLSYCGFEDRGTKGYSYAARGHATQKIRLTSCTVQGPRMLGILLSCEPKAGLFQGGDLHLEGCRFDGLSVMHLKAPHQDSQFRVRANRCVFEGSFFMVGSKTHEWRPTVVTAYDNLFKTTGSLFKVTKGNDEDFLEKLRWNGLNNIFNQECDFVSFLESPERDIAGLEGFVNSSSRITERISGAGSLMGRERDLIKTFFEDVGTGIRDAVDELRD